MQDPRPGAQDRSDALRETEPDLLVPWLGENMSLRPGATKDAQMLCTSEQSLLKLESLHVQL